MRDIQAVMTSLENSKGWFERALKDAEEAANLKADEHMKEMERVRIDCEKQMEVRGC